MKTIFVALLALAASAIAAPSAAPNTDCFVKRVDGLMERAPQGVSNPREAQIFCKVLIPFGRSAATKPSGMRLQKESAL